MGIRLWISVVQRNRTKWGKASLPICIFFGHCGQNTQTTKSMARKSLTEWSVENIFGGRQTAFVHGYLLSIRFVIFKNAPSKRAHHHLRTLNRGISFFLQPTTGIRFWNRMRLRIGFDLMSNQILHTWRVENVQKKATSGTHPPAWRGLKLYCIRASLFVHCPSQRLPFL